MSNKIFLTLVSVLILVGCSGNNANQSGLVLSCTATGTPVSGASTLSQTVSNLTIQTVGGSTGPFTITIPGVGTVTSPSPVYTYPGIVTLSAGSQIQVTDTSTQSVAVCSLNGSGGIINNLGGAIQLTISPATSVSSGPTVSTSVAVGQPVTLSATDGITTSVFGFAPTIQQPGVTITSLGTSSVSITSSIAATVTINVTDSSNPSATPAQATIYFGTSQGGVVNGGSLSCQLFAYTSTNGTCYNYGNMASFPVSSSFISGQPVCFDISTNTGEPLSVLQVNPGEPWTGVPPAQFPLPFGLVYQYNGSMSVAMSVQSASRQGVYCNGNGLVQTNIFVQPGFNYYSTPIYNGVYAYPH